MKTNEPLPIARLLSLDFMRGLIMVLLMLESTLFYERLGTATEGQPLYLLVRQFYHHPWHGLRFWDLIQPGFMFIAGTALAYSLHRQHAQGLSWGQSFRKALRRSGWLFFWGVLNYAVRPEGLSFELWNVLTQLSFTSLVAFLIYRWPTAAQIAFSLGLLLLADLLYRLIRVPGYDQPFVNHHNFGNFMDTVLMNKTDPDGWVAINCISTSCHTIWGMLAGKCLLSGDKDASHGTPAANSSKKIRTLFLAGALALLSGYLLDLSFTPIIKKIATASFVLVSGGWCLLALAFLYWWIDSKGHRKYLAFFTIVGMNSLFIYLFFEIVGARWLNGYIDAIVSGLTGQHAADAAGHGTGPVVGGLNVWTGLLSSAIIFTLEWLLCRFLYKKKIFLKI